MNEMINILLVYVGVSPSVEAEDSLASLGELAPYHTGIGVSEALYGVFHPLYLVEEGGEGVGDV